MELKLDSSAKILALLDKTYNDFCRCDGGESCLKIDGKEYYTDAAYAIDGVNIFMKVLKKRLGKVWRLANGTNNGRRNKAQN